MAQPTWEFAYYLPEDKEDATVDYVLLKRKAGLIKDGDLWSSKAQYISGAGFRLRANRCTTKRSYFSAWPGTYETKEWRDIVRTAGMRSAPISQIYRFHHLFRELYHGLINDPELKDSFSVSKVEISPNAGRATSADLVITHLDSFRRRTTLVSIIDRFRKREVETQEKLFTLNIQTWPDQHCLDFAGVGKGLVIRWWENNEARVKRIEERRRKQQQEALRQAELERQRREEAAIQRHVRVFGEEPPESDLLDIEALEGRIQDEEDRRQIEEKRRRREEAAIQRHVRAFGEEPPESDLLDIEALEGRIQDEEREEARRQREERVNAWEREKEKERKRLERESEEERIRNEIIPNIGGLSLGLLEQIRYLGVSGSYEYLGFLYFCRDLSNDLSVSGGRNARIPNIVQSYRAGVLTPEEFLESILDVEISTLHPWAMRVGRYSNWIGEATSGTILEILDLKDFFSEIETFEEIYKFLIQENARFKEMLLGKVRSQYLDVIGEEPSDDIRNSRNRMELNIEFEIKRQRREEAAIQRHVKAFGEEPSESDLRDIEALEEKIDEEERAEAKRKREEAIERRKEAAIERHVKAFGEEPPESELLDIEALEEKIDEEERAEAKRKREEEAIQRHVRAFGEEPPESELLDIEALEEKIDDEERSEAKRKREEEERQRKRDSLIQRHVKAFGDGPPESELLDIKALEDKIDKKERMRALLDSPAKGKKGEKNRRIRERKEYEAMVNRINKANNKKNESKSKRRIGTSRRSSSRGKRG